MLSDYASFITPMLRFFATPSSLLPRYFRHFARLQIIELMPPFSLLLMAAESPLIFSTLLQPLLFSAEAAADIGLPLRRRYAITPSR
jgi:hypothetical protein